MNARPIPPPSEASNTIEVSSGRLGALGASGTWGISITGNAGTVTNGVVTTGSYADPTWITSLSASKIAGTLPVANGGTGQSSYTDGQILIGNKDDSVTAGTASTAGSDACHGIANTLKRYSRSITSAAAMIAASRAIS